MTGPLYTSGDVAPRVGLTRAQLLYLLESEQIPGPSLTVRGRRLFTSDDVDRIARVLAERGRPTADLDRPAE